MERCKYRGVRLGGGWNGKKRHRRRELSKGLGQDLVMVEKRRFMYTSFIPKVYTHGTPLFECVPLKD